MKLDIIDNGKKMEVCQFLDDLCNELKTEDVIANWHKNIVKANSNSIILVHDPVNYNLIPTLSTVFGQRTLNRRQRLILAEQAGLPVPRWVSQFKEQAIEKLFEEWRVEHILYKSDLSFQRKNVFLLSKKNFREYRNSFSNGDVLMEPICGLSDTYKIDIFYDSIIGCRKLPTKSIHSPDFYKPCSDSSLEKVVPSSLHDSLRNLGKLLPHYGAGLTSVDFMLDTNMNPWVIELNTCSVGRDTTWSRWKPIYLEGYKAGIISWLRNFPFNSSFQKTESEILRDMSGGVYANG